MAHFLSEKLERDGAASRATWRVVTSMILGIGIVSGVNILMARTWWNKELSRMTPALIDVLNRTPRALLIVSGAYPTHLGDVLAMSGQLHQDVRIRLFRGPGHIDYFSSTNETVFWFPSSMRQMRKISQEQQLQVREVIAQVLWRIDGRSE